MDELIKKAKKLAYDENKKTGMPVKLHIDLSCNVGKKLAKNLKANVKIVEVGTLLMDCMIGQALKEGRMENHVQMSLNKANQLLETSSIDEETKENIRHCISEHHGAKKFHSIESEICCNADCYRFASIKGFIYTIRYLREMPLNDLLSLLEKKYKEKSGLLSLQICKNELKEQQVIILSLLNNLNN